MNRLFATGLWIGIAALCGCSKALTESSAVKVAQQFVDTQNGGTVSTDIRQLTSLLVSEQLQPLQQPGIQRLVKEGFIEEKKIMLPFPNFAGLFIGPYENNIIYTFHFQTVAANPPRIEGYYNDCLGGACWGGFLNGVVQRIGPSTVTLTQQGGDRIVRTLTASLTRGQPDVIAGTLGNITLGGQAGIRLEGHVIGPDIPTAVYIYSWTDKLSKDAITIVMFKLGHLVVDSCEHLLLGTETSATATCKTHINLTKEATVVFGNRPTEQSLQASFGKKPDGDWIGTQVNYSPPQYIMQ